MDEDTYCLNFDGGAQPNPGPCAGAFVIYNKNGVIAEGGKFITHGTNNIGEYTGLLRGIEYSIELGIRCLSVKGDSKLVVCQVNKEWKINNVELAKMQKQITDLITKFKYFKIEHVLRNENKVADKLSDETLEKKYSWVRFYEN